MHIPRKFLRLHKAANLAAYYPMRAITAVVDWSAGKAGAEEREPDLEQPVSQLVTQRQCESAVFDEWRAALHPLDRDMRYNRKLWEWVYILQVLASKGMLREGMRGLGFGVGREPLAALMAKRGCSIVATDLPAAADEVSNWTDSGQHAAQLADLNPETLCPPELFAQRVRFQPMDMRHLDPGLRGFDFLWSSCALEHLGCLADGIEFIHRSLAALCPGGLAVHTTEYNVGSNSFTMRSGGVVLYRRRDIEALADELRRDGHTIELNLHPGGGAIDRYVDPPPYYRRKQHLKLIVGPFAATSLGLWIRKAG
ncbi:MAG TPA: class I SAM-dependent methyltransferase [Thermoanaerobaculia bacterium]|nr:class I SAM-dependent methyltransferase [Thermoanaerobaculia bacterium]